MSTTINGDDANVPGTLTVGDIQIGSKKVIATGAHAIGNGVSTETITGLALATAPTAALLTVRSPAGGLVLVAISVVGSFSTDGFTFAMSGVTDSANYILDYILLA